MDLLNTSNTVLVSERYRKTRQSITTWVEEKDGDIFGLGLNPRSEVHVNQKFPLEMSHSILGSCEVSPNVTFLQVMASNDRNQGKPIFTLDTHHGYINLRIRDFSVLEAMKRIPICKYSPNIQFEVDYKLSKVGQLHCFCNGVSIGYFNKPLRWNNNNQSVISFGTYLTDKANTKVWPLRTVYTKLLLK